MTVLLQWNILWLGKRGFPLQERELGRERYALLCYIIHVITGRFYTYPLNGCGYVQSHTFELL